MEKQCLGPETDVPGKHISTRLGEKEMALFQEISSQALQASKHTVFHQCQLSSWSCSARLIPDGWKGDTRGCEKPHTDCGAEEPAAAPRGSAKPGLAMCPCCPQATTAGECLNKCSLFPVYLGVGLSLVTHRVIFCHLSLEESM